MVTTVRRGLRSNYVYIVIAAGVGNRDFSRMNMTAKRVHQSMRRPKEVDPMQARRALDQGQVVVASGAVLAV
jgi:hypothetical protein